jgi:ribosome biogenesis GTPase
MFFYLQPKLFRHLCINMKNLESLGFSNWFKDNVDTSKFDSHQIARVITVSKNRYIISNGREDVFAELTGKFMFNSDSPLDVPTVGDWVYVQLFDDDTFAVIHDIIPRKSLLKRKTSGSKIEYQLIAANIDVAMIMQSLDYNFNIRRLERYLVMINESNIQPILLLSKSDLTTKEEIEIKKSDINKVMPDLHIETFSNKNDSDIEGIKKLFNPGKTYCLLGSSGVGKTTLLNNLISEELFKTQPIRDKDGRGRHTTSRRELIVLKNGAIVVDNPGMRELGMMGIEAGLNDTFNEIYELSNQCRFNDCSHTIEEGCAILKALKEGVISNERYQNYIKMYKESLYNEMTYVQKRQKDKQFGKYIRSVMKHKKDKR